MNKAAFLAKYNDATSGLFKTGQSRGIGSDDMREMIQDLFDSVAFNDDQPLFRGRGDFAANGTPTTGSILYPSSGGSGSGGAIRKYDVWRITTADASFYAPVNSWLIAGEDAPGQDDTKWRVV